jgi:hypothetical protein
MVLVGEKGDPRDSGSSVKVSVGPKEDGLSWC